MKHEEFFRHIPSLVTLDDSFIEKVWSWSFFVWTSTLSFNMFRCFSHIFSSGKEDMTKHEICMETCFKCINIEEDSLQNLLLTPTLKYLEDALLN